MSAVPASRPQPFTVSQITGQVKLLLNETFPDVWVRGEISELRRNRASGHVYFKLKDSSSALACAMYRMAASSLRFAPVDGMEVDARGRVDIYKTEYQLIVQELIPGGRGALLLALEELRRRLAAEGLFDPARKKPLPRYPRRIGVVTSESGAAVRDILHVLGRRWPLAEVLVAPVVVQGEGAAAQIAYAVRRLGEIGSIDVILVARGGGSLEDLWAFNEEAVVRAIAASRVPVISGVGHETDRTLCDDAADVRAPTPSAAAEIVVPDRAELLRGIGAARARIERIAERGVRERRQRFLRLRERYGFRRPHDLFERWQRDVSTLHTRLGRAVESELRRSRQQAAELDGRLRALSPRGVLARGYALVHLPDGRLARAASELRAGDRIAIELARGGAAARVERTWEAPREEPAISPAPKEGA